MFAPGIPSVMETFGETNESVGTFCVSVYILVPSPQLSKIRRINRQGFAAGPLLWAPMSEMFGRASVFNFTNVLFVAFTLGCGFSNSILTLILLRFFAGFNGSACLALGGGVIADMIAPDSRGKATAIWSIGPLLGPVSPPSFKPHLLTKNRLLVPYVVDSCLNELVGDGSFTSLLLELVSWRWELSSFYERPTPSSSSNGRQRSYERRRETNIFDLH